MNAKVFGYELHELRIKKGFSLRQVERQSGVTNSMISKIENGKRNIPKPSTLKKLAHGLRVPYAKLLNMAGYAPKLPNNVIVPKGYVKIPILGSIPCGDPNTAIQETNQYKLVPDIEPHVGYFYLRADGRSMQPKIMNKALVKIHLQHTIENKEVAAVSVNCGDATLKQAIKNDDDKVTRFHPFNPEFGDIYPDANHICRIIGKAVAVENPL